jgi:hypothetical protein
MQGQRLGKDEPQSGYGIAQTLTIWLSLWGNSGSGDDCCGDHSPKQGQSRSRNTASHGFPKEAVRKWASEVVPIGAGRGTKKQMEIKKERRWMGRGREKGRGGVHVVPVNWDVCGTGAQGGPGQDIIQSGARQHLGAAPIQVDDASANDTSTAR